MGYDSVVWGVYDCGVVSWLLCLIVDLLAGFGEFRLVC